MLLLCLLQMLSGVMCCDVLVDEKTVFYVNKSIKSFSYYSKSTEFKRFYSNLVFLLLLSYQSIVIVSITLTKKRSSLYSEFKHFVIATYNPHLHVF